MNENEHPNAHEPIVAEANTRIALVLDRSGSMMKIREAARDAFNEAIERVRSDAQAASQSDLKTTLSIVRFNQNVDDVLVNAPVEEVRWLRSDEYQPDGMTALLDAISHAIDGLERAGPMGERDAALVIVISDGLENSSRTVTRERLVERMQALEATEQWTFSFLMANVDITDLSVQLGTERSNYADWKPTASGVADMGNMLSKGMERYLRYRRSGGRSEKEFFAGKD